MKNIGEQIKDGTLPVFPTTYAKDVVDHAALKQKRGKGKKPSMPFLDEKNPRKALQQATVVLEKPDGVIRDRLMRLREYLPNQQELVYKFAEYMATHTNAELVPQGFVLVAVLALYDVQKGIDSRTGKPIVGSIACQPAMVYRIIEMMIPTIAKVIFPADFAGVVRTTMDNVHEIQKKSWEEAKAAAPKPTINGDALQIFTAVRRIADLSFEFYRPMNTSGRKWSAGDRRSEGVNPYYNQTTGGLFLEQYYGGPGSIWTPWGKWGCWGGGCSGENEDPMPAFLNAIGEVKLHAAAKNVTQGTIGPIYAILKVGDIVLPAPELREKVSYFEYEQANCLWNEVSIQYSKK
jgi:hypothetical protein